MFVCMYVYSLYNLTCSLVTKFGKHILKNPEKYTVGWGIPRINVEGVLINIWDTEWLTY